MRTRPSCIAWRCALSVLIAVGALIAAPSAFAAFTASQITAPADGAYPQSNLNTPNNLHVEGTTSGGAGNADVVCYYGSSSKVVATNVTVTSGAFSTDVAMSQFPIAYCLLRAVPTGDAAVYAPDQTTSFAGPRLGVGQLQRATVGGSGPNKDLVHDLFLAQAQSRGYFDFWSVGGCALADSFVFDPLTFAQSNALYYCNGWLWTENGCPSTSPTCVVGDRSELQVDGMNAYLPGNAYYLYNIDATHSSKLLTGFPALTYSTSIDPLNGDARITETDPVVRCSPTATAFRASYTDTGWQTDCTSFVPLGVKLDHTSVTDRNGRRATLTDVWSSTDGASHQLDLLYDEDFLGDLGTNPPMAFQFPWISGSYTGPALGESVAGPSSDAPATVFVDGNGASPDTFLFPQGAVTYAPAPKDIKWYLKSVDRYEATFHFTVTVPTGGRVTIAHSYIDGSSKAEVADQISAEQDRLGMPRLAITSPADGATVADPAVTVEGTASDPGGAIAGVTVNDDAVSVASAGSWSKALTLSQGQNTITAVARDTAGNTTTTTAKVTYAPPATPSPSPPLLAAADKVAPTLGLAIARIKLAALVATGLPVRVSCSEPCTFVLAVLVDSKTAKRIGLAARTLTIGRASGKLPTAGSKKVTVKLTKKAKRVVARARKVALKLEMTAKDAAGNTATKSKRVTIKR